jgi:ATP-binding cassette subfamily B multidrug efflux pump
LFGRFENLVSPYPEGAPRSPPQSFVAFIWACSQGMRPILLGMTLCTAVIAMFEALLFSMLGHVVDWLTAVEPAQFWAKERGKLLFLAAVIAASPLVVAWRRFSSTRRWRQLPDAAALEFPPLMLGQSMSFYQDEFAGRIAAKVMQTALAVRDTWMIIGDDRRLRRHLLRHHVVVLGAFRPAGCCCRSRLARPLPRLRWFVPRLGKVAMQQADARSLMTGRIDRRLHQHRDRQALLALRSARRIRARGDAGVHATATLRCGSSPASRS